MFEIDFTGTEALEGLVEDMRERDVEVRLARIHAPVLRLLEKSGEIATVGEQRVFSQVEDAVGRR
jgi:SulP family sulfate permease